MISSAVIRERVIVSGEHLQTSSWAAGFPDPNNSVAADDEDALTVEISFESTGEFERFQQGSAPVTSARVTLDSGETVQVELTDNLFLAAPVPMRPISGLTLDLSLELTHLAVDETVPAQINLCLVDGVPRTPGSGREFVADSTVRTDAASMVDWIAGGDLIGREVPVERSGSLLLVGAARGALCIHGGFHLPENVSFATEILTELIDRRRQCIRRGAAAKS